MQSEATPPVHWLGLTDIADLEALQRRFRDGQLPPSSCALGLPSVPSAELLDLLLLHSSIVLWPDHDTSGRADVDHGWTMSKETLDKLWGKNLDLPRHLTEAYRQRWETAPEPGPPLSLLRAVWEDTGWLEFCWFLHWSLHPLAG